MNATKPVRTSRRSFFWKLGAGVSTAVASTASMATAGTARSDDLSLRVALLKEEMALRRLHQAYERAMDKGLHEQAIGLFADNAEVVFSGHVFDQRCQGVSRLYRELFREGRTGMRMEPAPGFEPDASLQQEKVEVAPDRQSASASFPYSIQVGMPLESESSLASMARLHGEGVQTWWEGGVYNATYVKDETDGRWKIRRFEFNTLSRADYRPGRSYAVPMSASPLSARHLA